jgi:hypothetical protein
MPRSRAALFLFALAVSGSSTQAQLFRAPDPTPPDIIEISQMTTPCARDWNGECGGQAKGTCVTK